MFEITCMDASNNPIEFFTQWDTNQSIYIHGLELDEAPIVHYCNDGDTAFAYQSTMTDGVIHSTVPNFLLEQTERIYIYLYAYDFKTKSGRTIHVAKIPVRAKSSMPPDDYVNTESIHGINVVALDDRVRGLIQSRDKMTNDIKKLQEDTGLLQSDLTNTNVNVSNNRADIDEVSRNLSSESGRINGEISTLKQADTNLSNDVNALERTASGIREDLNTFKSDTNGEISKLKSADTDMNSSIVDINEFIQTITNNVTDHEQRIGDNTTEIGKKLPTATFNEKVVAYDERFTTIETDVSGLKDVQEKCTNFFREEEVTGDGTNIIKISSFGAGPDYHCISACNASYSSCPINIIAFAPNVNGDSGYSVFFEDNIPTGTTINIRSAWIYAHEFLYIVKP